MFKMKMSKTKIWLKIFEISSSPLPSGERAGVRGQEVAVE
jgi:hypothetical protein